jgi:cell division transport system permease protein
MIRAKRIVTFAGQNFIRNAWLSAVTLTVLVIMLLAVNLIISVNYTKDILLKNVQNKIDVTINFKANVTDKDVNQLAETLKKNTKVSSVTVITPEQNLENFKAKFKEIGDKIIPALDRNPLSYKLQVKAEDPADYQGIIDQINKSEFAALVESQKLNDYRLFFQQAESFIDKLNLFGLIIAAIFLLLGIIVVFNTIRVSVYTQREEVGIMKLVGATNWFVRAPFMLETVFYALAATMVTFLIIYPILRFSNFVNFQIIDGVTLNLIGYYTQNFWLFFLTQFLAIAVVNLLATTVALRRYLKV